MYREYWYKSGLNGSMRNALRDVVRGIRDRIDLYEGDVVLDIGANDGTMLAMFPEECITIGVEPALNLQDELEENCSYAIPEYFSASLLDDEPGRKPKVVSSIAMFYDLPDPMQFTRDVYSVLDDKGIWVIQFTDLVSMLRTNAFDNICHEHLEYYSLDVMAYILHLNGFSIFDIEYNDVNGASIRLWVDKGWRPEQPSVERAFAKEYTYFDKYEDPLAVFATRVEKIKEMCVSRLYELHAYGETIMGMGASTKGNTLLQYFGLPNEWIQCILEINEDKYGRVTVGSEIPIFPQSSTPDVLKYPDVMLPLPWHFIEGFVEKCDDFLEQGGRFFVPLPWPKIIYKKGGQRMDKYLGPDDPVAEEYLWTLREDQSES
jgi:hypothetical protein